MSVSYEVQIVGNDLTYFTYFESKKEGVTNPSHVNKDKFTIAAVDNFDHPDRPSLSGKVSNNGTAMNFFKLSHQKKLMKHKSTILK